MGAEALTPVQAASLVLQDPLHPVLRVLQFVQGGNACANRGFVLQEQFADRIRAGMITGAEAVE